MPQNSLDNLTVTVDDGLDVLTIQAARGDNLLAVLQKSGKPLHAPCGGKGTCHKCQVEIAGIGATLACQYSVQRDIFVRLPEYERYAILEKSSQTTRRLENDAGLLFRQRAGEKVVCFKDQEIYIKPAAAAAATKFGLAIDVGTTTVVVFLENLDSYQLVDTVSFVNPQTACGGDVISRIHFCIEQKDGLQILQQALIEAINRAIFRLCRDNNLAPEQLLLAAFAGNTVMLHLLLGVDPRSIAFAPFTPVFVEEKLVRAEDLNLAIHPRGVARILPSLAGYVGADIIAGVAATDVLDCDGYTLYLDIGTNGEIALGNREKIFCCATAAGPAFEGARIECGLGGVAGAISAYEADECTTIAGAPPIGICGSGLIDIVAALLDRRVIDASGYMAQNFCLVEAAKTGINRDIVLTPQDVREVQLAKAAIYAGLSTLVKIAGITLADIERLYLAGGFGNYIRVDSAMRIGLIPQVLKDKIIPIGNAAGAGARLALKSLAFEAEIERVLARAEYVELSTRADFNETFVAAMAFAEATN